MVVPSIAPATLERAADTVVVFGDSIFDAAYRSALAHDAARDAYWMALDEVKCTNDP